MTIKEFDIDAELQTIAGKLVEGGFNYGGALFENDKGVEYVITVTDANYMHGLKERVAKLEKALQSSFDLLLTSGWGDEYKSDINEITKLLEQSK